jgi:membrane-associated phospholipid phosphatase
MSVTLLFGLLAGCGILMALERHGLPTTLALHFKGDVKRETRWFAQYGQFACTVVAALLVWRIDARHYVKWAALGMVLIVLGTSVAAMGIKRLVSRIRPGRENAGRFLGPHLRHANFRESFPSSHSACAVAMTVVLATLYHEGAVVFWSLAILCALLRYVLDAHWPSDILGGIALGYGLAHVGIWLFNIHP